METKHRKLANGIDLLMRKPAGKESLPAVILCHGFCGIKALLLPAFAEAFVRAGFAAITFDYRGFGDSEGERGRLVPAMQIEDILSVVSWARKQPEIDARRVGLWGTSFGGCHVFEAAAQDTGIKCIISQLAFADGEEIVTGKMRADEKISFLETLDKMAAKKQQTGKEMMVAITRVVNDDESKAFFENYRASHPEMDIKIPFLTVRETVLYHPARSAARITCPALVVIAENDGVNPPEQGRALFNAAGSACKKLHTEAGARHYDLYSGAHFDSVVRIQTAWLQEHL